MPLDDFNIVVWVYNLFGPFRDYLLAIISLALSFLYGNSFEYVFGIFSILSLSLFLILGSEIFLYLTIGSVMLLGAVKLIPLINQTLNY